MVYVARDLPYAYTALEPYIDALTMETHFTKHHAAYVNNVNAALDKFPEFKGTGIVELNQLVGTDKIPTEIARVVRNNGGGHWNHAFFWKVMCGPTDTNGPSADLKAAIESAFGSIDEMKTKFNSAAATVFGSGWAWVVFDPSEDKLQITSTPNQDNPLMSLVADCPGIPILGLDVWEHAYYLKYQSRRTEYISNFHNVINWEQVGENYAKATKGIVFSP